MVAFADKMNAGTIIIIVIVKMNIARETILLCNQVFGVINLNYDYQGLIEGRFVDSFKSVLSR